MLSKYNINVDVKYKRIETELLDNYSNKVSDKKVDTNKLAKEFPNRAFDEDYDEEDIKFICEELYRFELLSAFKAETILDDAIDNGLTELWSFINNKSINNNINNSSTKEFIELVEKFSERMGIALLDSNDNKDATNKLAFSLMFNYDLYYIIHLCLREYVKNGKINKSLLVQLDLEINKINCN